MTDSSQMSLSNKQTVQRVVRDMGVCESSCKSCAREERKGCRNKSLGSAGLRKVIEDMLACLKTFGLFPAEAIKNQPLGMTNGTTVPIWHIKPDKKKKKTVFSVSLKLNCTKFIHTRLP